MANLKPADLTAPSEGDDGNITDAEKAAIDYEMATGATPKNAAQAVDHEDPASPFAILGLSELDAIIAQRSRKSPTGQLRAPFIFTRIGRAKGLYAPSTGDTWQYIYASLNPSEVAWTFALREELEKCGGGEVLHSFQASEERQERLGKFLDEIKISYTLNTGNCLPIHVGNGELRIPSGFDAFLAITELLFEDPRVLPDGSSNDLLVIHSSVLFPQITVEGKLDPAGWSFTESAESPSELRGVNFSISAHATTPRVTNHAALRANFQAAQFGQGK